MASKQKPIVMNARLRNILSEQARKMSAQQRKVALSFVLVKTSEFNGNLRPLGNDADVPEMAILFNLKLLIVEKHQPLGNLTYFEAVSNEKVADVIKAYIDDIFSCNFEVINTISPSDKKTLQILNCLKMCRVNHSLKYNVGPFFNIIHIFDTAYLMRDLLGLLQTGTIYFTHEGTEVEASYFDAFNTAGNDLTVVLEGIKSNNTSKTAQAVSTFYTIANSILRSNEQHNSTSNFCNLMVKIFGSLTTDKDTNNISYDSLWDKAIELFKSAYYEAGPQLSEEQYKKVEACMITASRMRTLRKYLGHKFMTPLEESDEEAKKNILERMFTQNIFLRSLNVEEQAKQTMSRHSTEIAYIYNDDEDFSMALMKEFCTTTNGFKVKNAPVGELQTYLLHNLVTENGGNKETYSKEAPQKINSRNKLRKVPDEINTQKSQNKEASVESKERIPLLCSKEADSVESKKSVPVLYDIKFGGTKENKIDNSNSENRNVQIVAATKKEHNLTDKSEKLNEIQTQSLEVAKKENDDLILQVAKATSSANRSMNYEEQNKTNERNQQKLQNVGENIVHNSIQAVYLNTNCKQINFVTTTSTCDETRMNITSNIITQYQPDLGCTQEQNKTFDKTELKDSTNNSYQSQFLKTEHSYSTSRHSKEHENKYTQQKANNQHHLKSSKLISEEIEKSVQIIIYTDNPEDSFVKNDSNKRPETNEATKKHADFSKPNSLEAKEKNSNEMKMNNSGFSFFQTSMLEHYTIYTVADGIRTLLIPEKRGDQSKENERLLIEDVASKYKKGCDKNNATHKSYKAKSKTNYKHKKFGQKENNEVAKIKVGEDKLAKSSEGEKPDFTKQDMHSKENKEMDLDEDCNKKHELIVENIGQKIITGNLTSKLNKVAKTKFSDDKLRLSSESKVSDFTVRDSEENKKCFDKDCNEKAEELNINKIAAETLIPNKYIGESKTKGDIQKCSTIPRKRTKYEKTKVEINCTQTKNTKIVHKASFISHSFVVKIENENVSENKGSNDIEIIFCDDSGANLVIENNEAIEAKSQEQCVINKTTDGLQNHTAGKNKSNIEAESENKHQAFVKASNYIAEEKKEAKTKDCNKGKSKDTKNEVLIIDESAKLQISKLIGCKLNCQNESKNKQNSQRTDGGKEDNENKRELKKILTEEIKINNIQNNDVCKEKSKADTSKDTSTSLESRSDKTDDVFKKQSKQEFTDALYEKNVHAYNASTKENNETKTTKNAAVDKCNSKVKLNDQKIDEISKDTCDNKINVINKKTQQYESDNVKLDNGEQQGKDENKTVDGGDINVNNISANETFARKKEQIKSQELLQKTSGGEIKFNHDKTKESLSKHKDITDDFSEDGNENGEEEMDSLIKLDRKAFYFRRRILKPKRILQLEQNTCGKEKGKTTDTLQKFEDVQRGKVKKDKKCEEPNSVHEKSSNNKEFNKNCVLTNAKVNINESEQRNESIEFNSANKQNKEDKFKSGDEVNKEKKYKNGDGHCNHRCNENEKLSVNIKDLKKQNKNTKNKFEEQNKENLPNNENMYKENVSLVKTDNFNINIYQATVVDEQNNLTKLENTSQIITMKVESCQDDKENINQNGVIIQSTAKENGEHNQDCAVENQDIVEQTHNILADLTNINRTNTNSDTQHNNESTQLKSDLNNNDGTSSPTLHNDNRRKQCRKHCRRIYVDDGINKQLNKLATDAQQKANNWDEETRQTTNFGNTHRQDTKEFCESNHGNDKAELDSSKDPIFVFSSDQTLEEKNSNVIQNESLINAANEKLKTSLPRIKAFLEQLKNTPKNLANITSTKQSEPINQSKAKDLKPLELSKLKSVPTKLNQSEGGNLEQQNPISKLKSVPTKPNQSEGGNLEQQVPISKLKSVPTKLNQSKGGNLEQQDPLSTLISVLTKLNQSEGTNLEKQDPIIIEETKLNQPNYTTTLELGDLKLELTISNQPEPITLKQQPQPANQSEPTDLTEPTNVKQPEPQIEEFCMRCHRGYSLAELNNYVMSHKEEYLDACDDCLNSLFYINPSELKIDMSSNIEVFKPKNIPSTYSEPMEIKYCDDDQEGGSETNKLSNTDEEKITNTRNRFKKNSKKNKKKKRHCFKAKNQTLQNENSVNDKANERESANDKANENDKLNKNESANDKANENKSANNNVESDLPEEISKTKRTHNNRYSKDAILAAFEITKFKQKAKELESTMMNVSAVLQDMVKYMGKIPVCENMQLVNRVLELLNYFLQKIDVGNQEATTNVTTAALSPALSIIQECICDGISREKLERIIYLLQGLLAEDGQIGEPVDLTNLTCFDAWEFTIGGAQEIFHNIHSMDTVDDILCTRMLSCNSLFDLIYMLTSTDKQRVVDEYDCSYLVDAQVDYSFKDDYNITLRPDTK